MTNLKGLRTVRGTIACPPFTNGGYIWKNAPGDEYPRGASDTGIPNTPWLDFELYTSKLDRPCRAGAVRVQLIRTPEYPLVTGTWDGNADVALKVYNVNYAVNVSAGRLISIDYQSRTNADCSIVQGIEGNTRVSVGKTAATMIGISHTCEIYGTVSTTLYGMSIDMRNEGAAATTSAGIRITNSNNSLAIPIGAAIRLEHSGADVNNTGFNYIIDALASDCINTAVLRVYDDGTVCNDTYATGTFATYQKGYLTVVVGTATRYIWLADTAPTA